MPKKNVKFIPTRPVEAHPHSRHPEAHPHSLCHPEGRSPVRVSGQVDTVFGSQGPHALQAQDDEERKKDSGRRASGEQGRSMVEMLGTLAIMGVLSIGGVAGYRYAVDKANANAILDGVNKRAVIVSQQRIVGQEVNLSEFEADIKGAYPTTAEIYADSRFFAVLVDKVPQGVCDHILREKTRFASDVFVSTGAGTGVDDCPEGESMIEFTFANDFNAGEQLERCTTKSDCASACEDCQNGVCVESCPSGQGCGININNAHTKTCCSLDNMVDGFCCSSVSENESGQKTCCVSWNGLCCPPGQFMPNKNNGQCIDCSSTTVFYFPSGQACSMCPNRVTDSAFYCRLSCPDGMIEENGYCKCPLDKPLHGVHSQGGKCFACDEGADTGYVWDNPVGMTGVGTACNWCNFNYGGGYCWRCATGTVAQGGTCVDCAEVDISALTYKAPCESCGGTWTGEWNNGTCTPPAE